MPFTHLHLHSPYSLLDGFCKMDQLMPLLKDMGMDSCAITDHGNMFGVLQFYKAARAAGIHPILGCEIYVSPDQKDFSDRTAYHLVLLAENNQGYRNLIRIVSSGYVDGYHHGRPHVDKGVLKAFHQGLIALSACLSGEPAKKILESSYEEARKACEEYQAIFGSENYFLEIQDHGIREEKIVLRTLGKIHQETGIPLVATNDCHYLREEDSLAHDILLCIQTGKTLTEENRMRFSSSDFYVKSPEEMAELFSDYPDALQNTEKIARRCQVEIPFHQLHLPHFELPEGETNAHYLRSLVEEGIDFRYQPKAPSLAGENTAPSEEAKILYKTAKARAAHELSVIEKMGYVDYFLIVWDFVRFAKKNAIPVGPGRGSAAGSIVSYALKITEIDPLQYGLLFERFLNPDRVSMPDIDIDFDYVRREEVIDYVKEKYGKDSVAQIVTFGTMAAKNAIRDVGRVLDIPLGRVDRIAKAVPNRLKITLKEALEEDPDFKKIYEESEENKKLIDLAEAVEGMPRHSSTHAAGVLIAAEPVDHLVPLSRNRDQITTQYNMTELEELGLLKMDFLGLRTLTVIDDALKMIEKTRGKKPDLSSINFRDPRIFALFSRAETIGIFQFESNGMRAFLKDLKPDRFEDLVAANALFRPGPMDQIPTYVAARHNPEKLSYLHPLLEPILKDTYGVIVYQEQVMQIVQLLAGYSLGEADNLRRAMSKKKMAVMEENRSIFVRGKKGPKGEKEIAGCKEKGIPESIANTIYDQMIEFAKYAFNKSHSVAYAYLAMQTAYLKVYYPREFFAALLTSVMGDADKVSLYIREADRMGVGLLGPSVNRSLADFTVEDGGEEKNTGKIRYGLHAVKNVGTAIVEATLAARKKGGLFPNLEAYFKRTLDVDENALNKKAIESLIKAGAFDDFGLHRSQLMQEMERTLDAIQQERRRNLAGQMNLFHFIQPPEKPKSQVPEYPKALFLAYEKEVLGIYLTDHPFSPYAKTFAPFVSFSMEELLSEDDPQRLDGKRVRMAGIVRGRRDLLTKKNQKMCFVQFEDAFGMMEAVVFPSVFQSVQSLLKVDAPLLFSGRLQEQNGNIQILVDRVFGMEELPQKSLFLSLDSTDHAQYDQVKSLLLAHPGSNPVILYFADRKSAVRMDQRYNVNAEKDLIRDLKALLGQDMVVVK